MIHLCFLPSGNFVIEKDLPFCVGETADLAKQKFIQEIIGKALPYEVNPQK